MICGSALAPMEAYLLPDSHDSVAKQANFALYHYLRSTGHSAAAAFMDGVHQPFNARKAAKRDESLAARWRLANYRVAKAQNVWMCVPAQKVSTFKRLV